MARIIVFIRFFEIGAVVMLAALYVYSGIMKIRTPGEFADRLYAYELFPRWSIAPLAILIPWHELVAGVALIVPNLRRAAALMLAILAAGFIFTGGWVMAHGLDIGCGCFGYERFALDWRWLVFDHVLLVFAIFVFVCQRRFSRLASVTTDGDECDRSVVHLDGGLKERSL